MHLECTNLGAIAQAKLQGTSPLMQFHWGFECNFYTASFSLKNPNPFISDDWHQPPVAPLGLDSSCMLFFAVNLSIPLPLPCSPPTPFKFFIDLMLPLQRLSNSFSLNTFGCSSEMGWEEKWFQAENLKTLYMSSVQRLKSSELL